MSVNIVCLRILLPFFLLPIAAPNIRRIEKENTIGSWWNEDELVVVECFCVFLKKWFKTRLDPLQTKEERPSSIIFINL